MEKNKELYQNFLRERINSLTEDLDSFCKGLDLEVPSTGEKMNLSLYVDESLVGKVKSAIKEGYFTSLHDVVIIIKDKIVEFEEEHGELPYLDPRVTLKVTGRKRKTIDARLQTMLKNFQKQIIMLKKELDDQE